MEKMAKTVSEELCLSAPTRPKMAKYGLDLCGIDYQGYADALQNNRNLIVQEISFKDLVLAHGEFQSILGNELNSTEDLVDCMITKLGSQSSELYEHFLLALQSVSVKVLSAIQEPHIFGEWTIRNNLTQLVEGLEVDETLSILKPHLSSDALAEITSGRTNGDKVLNLTHLISKRLQCHDTALFDIFMRALAGLNPNLFILLTGRKPTEKEVEECIQTDIENLKLVIQEIGHETDKEGDNKIDLEKNYVKLRVMETKEVLQNISESPLSDSTPPIVYQSTLCKSDRDIEDVLDEVKTDGTFCLMQGRCGIGKTTMAQHACRRWAKGKCLRQFSFVFFIPLRRLSVNIEKVSLYEFLTKYSLYPNKLPSQWMKNWSKKILINVDGLDELPNLAAKLHNVREIRDIHEEASAEELCLNLLKRNLMPAATLVCTSRTFEGLNALQPDVNLEVMGLTQDDVHDFIAKNVAVDNQAKVTSTLIGNPLLMSVCSITYYASVLCRVLASNHPLSASEIETYSRLTAFLIRTYPLRQSSEITKQIQCFASFKTLSEIAHHAETNGDGGNGLIKITLDMDDIPDIATPDVANAIKVATENGLVHITRVKVGERCKNILEFPHLSVQEFFAALHFLKEENGLREENLESLLKDGTLNMLQLFLFGVAFDEMPSTDLMYIKKFAIGKTMSNVQKAFMMKSFESLLEEKRFTYSLLKATQIAYEAQSDILGAKVSQYFSSEHTCIIGGQPLNALDIKALAFVIKRIKMPKITLAGVNLDNHSVGILMDCLKHRKELKHLNLCHNQIGEEGLVYISEMLKTNPDFEELILDGNGINSSSLQGLLPGLALKREILAFSIGGNDIQDKGAQALALALQNTTSLTSFNVSYNHIGPKGINALLDLTGKMRNLRSLILGGNSVGDQLIKSLFNTKVKATKLEYLSLNDTLVTNRGASLIAANLSVLDCIRYIGLKNCQIGTSGARAILEASRGCKQKVKLELNENQINTLKLDRNTTDCNLLSNTLGSERVRQITLNVSKGKKVHDVLDVSNCCIQDCDVPVLCRSFMSNDSLTEIDLVGNGITDEAVRHLACLAFTCPNLTRINVAKTKVSKDTYSQLLDLKIRHEAESLDLSGYKLDSTGIKCLSDMIQSKETALVSLNMSNCGIDDERMKAIGASLEVNFSLKHLVLSENAIGISGGTVIGTLLKNNSTLQRLNLNGNRVGEEGGSAIAAALGQNTSLTYIDLSSNRIGAKGGVAFGAALLNNSTLTQIDLSENGVGRAGGKSIGAALAKNTALSSVDLSGNGIGVEGAQAVGKALVENTSLKQILLQRNRIGDEGGMAIGHALARNISLTEINLSGNGIGEESGKAMGDALSRNTALTSINLSDNDIGEEGGMAIGIGLAENKTLNQLDVSYNKIGVKGALSISTALKQNNSLCNINLTFNRLGEMGGKYIADALAINSSLQQVDIKSNGLCGEGGKALASALAQNETLTTLGIGTNFLGEEVWNQIGQALEKNKSLKQIDMSWAGLGEAGWSAVLAALQRNTTLTEINLSKNVGGDIARIGAALAVNTTLQQIDLSDNFIGPQGGNAFWLEFSHNTTLNQLNLKNNSISGEIGKNKSRSQPSNGMSTFAFAMADNNCLSTIDLSGNKLCWKGAQAIGTALKLNKSLRQIDLSDNSIGDVGCKAIARGLVHNDSLTEINLSSNRFKAEGGISIANVLIHNTRLCMIDISRNIVGEEAGMAIASSLAQNTTLLQIKMRNLGLEANSAKAISVALAENNTLSQIDLSLNEFCDEGGKAIGEMLAINTSLTHIDLRETLLSDQAGKNIFDSLVHNTSLIEVNLGYNLLEDQSGKAIAAALRENAVLQMLDISNNKIGDESWYAIGDALKGNSALSKIFLRCNGIGTAGGKAIAAALAQNTTLRTIDLSSNDLNAEVGKAMGQALLDNTTLKHLDLHSNSLGIDGVKAIEASLVENTTLSSVNLEHNGCQTEWKDTSYPDKIVKGLMFMLDKGLNRYSVQN